MSSSKSNSCLGVGGSGLSVLGFVIGLYPSWNCSGGGNMVSSLTLFRGTGLGFTLPFSSSRWGCWFFSLVH